MADETVQNTDEEWVKPPGRDTYVPVPPAPVTPAPAAPAPKPVETADEPTPFGGPGGPVVIPIPGKVIPLGGPNAGKAIPIKEAAAHPEMLKTPEPFIPQKVIFDSPKEADHYKYMLTPKEQYDELARRGAIEAGSQFIPAEKFGEDWKYIPKSDLDKAKAIANINELNTARDQETYNNALKKLADYKSGNGDNYDIAAYLRKGGDAAVLWQAGFKKDEIQGAVKYNRDNYGIGAPDYVPISTYVQDYFKQKGWDYGESLLSGRTPGGKTASLDDIKQFNDRAEEAIIAHDREFRPVVSRNTFIENYLAGKGVSEPSFIELSETKAQKVLSDYAAKVEEADNAYKQKYGEDALFQSKIAIIAPLLFAPGRALAPEVDIEEIKPMEWAIGAAQVATSIMPFVSSPARMLLSGAAGAVFTADTVQKWDGMSTPQKVLSVGVDLLILFPFIKGTVSQFKLTSVKVPLAAGGEKTIWKGLAVGDKPVVGVSGNKLTLGTGNIEYPDATELVLGSGEGKAYRPITKLETNIMTTRNALAKMGMPDDEAEKLIKTLQTRSMFAGKKSPYLTNPTEQSPVSTLNKDSVSTVLSESVAQGDKVTEIYGSSTMQPQLESSLRGWRVPGDIDIQTAMNADDTADFANDLVAKLQETQGKGNVRISADSPTLIESKVNGKWAHAVDIHSVDEIADIPQLLTQTPAPLDPTAKHTLDMSYGMKVPENTVKVTYPGIGELDIMSLSESGKRKADAILRWRQDVEGIKNMVISPAEHRVKDIADYYVTLRTFKGAGIANDWAKVWGFDPDTLVGISETLPAKDVAWTFKPSQATATAGGSPMIQLSVPSSLASSVPVSLISKISEPVSPYASPSAPKSAAASPGATAVSSPPSTVIATKSPGVASTGVKPVVSTPVTPSTGTRSAKATSSSPSTSSTGTTSPKVKVAESSPVVSPPSPKISPPVAVPSPSVKPSSGKPSPPASPTPGSPPPGTTVKPVKPSEDGSIRINIDSKSPEEKAVKQDFTGAVAWKMGELNGKPEYIVLKYPYREPQDLISMDSVPDGAVLATGKDSAYRTARILKGIGPKNVNADVGMMDVNVTSKGRNVTLRFKPDPHGKTNYPLHLGKPRVADNGLRSQKQGRIYHTKVGGGTLLSRRPLGRSRRG